MHKAISDPSVLSKIKRGEINFGGNTKLKIYGILQCASGKRMKKANRVFFDSEKEAVEYGYRPCAYCRRTAYQKYKNGLIP